MQGLTKAYLDDPISEVQLIHRLIQKVVHLDGLAVSQGGTHMAYFGC